MHTRMSLSSKWVRMADTLNHRVVHTPYMRSAVYFAAAIAVFLTFYFLMSQLTVIRH